MPLTTAGANALLDNLETNAPYLTFFSADPTVTGSLAAELADDANLPRIDVSAALAAAAAASKGNTTQVVITAGADIPSAISHVGFATTPGAGTGVVHFFELLRNAGGTATPRTLSSGDTITFDVGTMTLTAS